MLIYSRHEIESTLRHANVSILVRKYVQPLHAAPVPYTAGVLAILRGCPDACSVG